MGIVGMVKGVTISLWDPVIPDAFQPEPINRELGGTTVYRIDTNEPSS